MRKLIQTIVLFCLLNGSVLYLLEFRYAGYLNPYDIIFKGVEQNKDRYTDIYIGNSHTMALKTYTGDSNATVVNIATPGQDLFKTYTILKKWVPLMKNVKRIYFGLDYETIGQNLSLSGLDFEDRQLYRYTDTMYKYSIDNIVMARSNFFRSNRDLKYLYKGQDLENLQNYIPPVTILSDENCKKRALEHTQIRFKKNLIAENTGYLIEIFKLAQTYNKKLVVFIPPKSTCYKEHSLKENVLFSKNIVDSVLGKNFITCLNFYSDPTFTQEYFLDYDHLNEKGRKKLIDTINLSLKEN